MSRILKEFQGNGQTSLDAFVERFAKLGKLTRIGGEQRVYEIAGEGQEGAVYSISTSIQAIAFGWKGSPQAITTVYYWKVFSFNRTPDYAVDIPAGADADVVAPMIMKMIADKTEGRVEI